MFYGKRSVSLLTEPEMIRTKLVHRTFPVICLLIILSISSSGIASESDVSKQGTKIDFVERTRQLIDVVEDLRGLSFLFDLPVELVTQDEMAVIIDEALSAQVTPEMNHGFTSMYIMLGLMPQGSNLLVEYQEMSEEQVIGLYDQNEKKFYVVDVDIGQMLGDMFEDSGPLGSFLGGLLGNSNQEANDAMIDTVIVHELTHALDDQHFNLEDRLADLIDGNSDDAQLAFMSLLEGNAVRIQNQYTIDYLGMSEMMLDMMAGLNETAADLFMNYDPFLERILLAPYMDGEIFVDYIVSNEGEDRLDRVFADPPVSMEQVLHPRLYLYERDDPSFTEPADMSGVLGNWELETTDTLGELITGMVIEFNTGNVAVAERVALGWDYDVITTWRSPDNDLAFAWITIWDGEDDAGEFYDAYTDLLEVKYPPGDWETLTSDFAVYTGMGLAVGVEWDGRVVVVVEGVPETDLDACLDAVWPYNVNYR